MKKNKVKAFIKMPIEIEVPASIVPKIILFKATEDVIKIACEASYPRIDVYVKTGKVLTKQELPTTLTLGKDGLPETCLIQNSGLEGVILLSNN